MRRKKYTIEEVKIFAQRKNGMCLSETYEHNKKNLLWKCLKCEHEWHATFKAINIQNQWCPNCAKRPKRTIEDAKKLAVERNGICLSKKYINNKHNLLWKCNKCEFVWKARFDRVNSGTWCPSCNRSRGERAVEKYLNHKNIDFDIEWYIPKGGKLRFDFYIPSRKLFIEYDGIQHFKLHPRYAPNKFTLDKNQSRDKQKTDFCLQNGYNLIRIHYIHLNRIENILNRCLELDTQIILTSHKYEYLNLNEHRSVVIV